MQLGKPYEMRIEPAKPINGKKQFAFRLRFDGRTQPVEFEVSGTDAMSIMLALHDLQVKHKLPIPQRAVKRRKPTLSIVSDGEQ